MQPGGNQNAVATKEQILLAVNKAFYNALQAHAVLTVAQQTVNERQTVTNQVEALFKSKLKSELDSVLQASIWRKPNFCCWTRKTTRTPPSLRCLWSSVSKPAGVSAGRGSEPVDSPPGNVNDLISSLCRAAGNTFATVPVSVCQEISNRRTRLTLSQRPRPGGGRRHACRKWPLWLRYLMLEQHLRRGRRKCRDPLFNGFLYTARAREANLRAQVTQERLLDMRNSISRDVRTSC